MRFGKRYRHSLSGSRSNRRQKRRYYKSLSGPGKHHFFGKGII